MKIICPGCNSSYNVPSEKIPQKKAVATCKKCGGTIEFDPHKVDQTEAIPDETLQPSTPSSIVDSSKMKSDELMDKDVTDTDLSIFIGEKSEKYLSKFQKFRNGTTDTFSITWHWPAFFTGIWWPLYRKLYLWAFINFLVSIIPLVGFAWMIVLGMIGNYVYYKHAKKKILEIKSLHASSDISISLAQAGGVNRWVITVVTVLVGISILGILAAILVPMLIEGY